MRTPLTAFRSALRAVVGAAVLTAVAAGPAAADPDQRQRQSLVHDTPRVPLVVDGVRYAPQQIHRFDGRPLYMRVARDGQALIAYTKLADYRFDLRRRGLTLPRRSRLASAKARVAWRGHWIRLCTGSNLDGSCWGLNSGFGVANFEAIWIGYVNNISSVQSFGQNSVLYDNPDFDPSRGILVIPPGVVRSLSDFGWDNRVQSAFMYW